MKDSNLFKLSILTLILSISGIVIVLDKSDFKIDFDEISLSLLGSIFGTLLAFFFSNVLRNKKSKRVLITYTNSDSKEAQLIKKFLIENKITTNTFDEYLTVGEPIITDIKSIIKKSDIILILISRDIYKSKYYKAIISLAIKERKKILPILLDESKLPNNLGNYVYLDIRDKEEYELKELYEKIISL
ncbi:toll/interleukin-1 receptor domain-containing protein [Flavobacterium sp. AJR]|uniref:toll/interleukin-1 receptor domain-containing protein n=1 Tax=Flavobacterium sp. AJR TaxID=1979369 RepID=UPI000A3D85A9|nr:toll/interleukin-1 receptor domain-containing protein [Flavobacterium sp. AJR]OUL60325.1 hypothetical protein B8T70_20930 [Flavobacterium sp. AJR]